ncbi:cysteine desulfurase family protein [Fervidibacillus halotolerans]|uniref:Cysteine desulfurase n=1 Tax=Fervidibacillus halotolerans TaxID=2980027 RepID=A0A9E8LZ72_9BACI|nr:cysteine desulfurase family protein [Fervidibacillus halotolerans]WAA11696.1 cysteine desulfurase [Fervidibacillus halotolerans]
MIYFDNSATTKPNEEVLDTFHKVASIYYGNPSSVHSFGLQTEKLLAQARRQIASLLNVGESEIYFTSGGTESNNLAIKGVANQFRNRGKHLITTKIEHPSVENACEYLKKDGFDITYLPVDENGRIHLDDLKKAIRDDTILVSIMHVNNEIGVIQPIEEIGSLLQNYPKILFHVDVVQGIGKVPIDFHKSQIDLATISAHKFHGLKGTGALYVREGVKLTPLLHGGNQEKGLRSGTENVPGIVAMAKALRLAFEDFNQKRHEMEKIRDYLRHELIKIDQTTINTPEMHIAPHILNFSVEGFKAEVLVNTFSEKQLYVSTTSACSSKRNEPSKTLLAMGVDQKRAESSIRISLSYENTIQEAERAVKVIKSSIEKLLPVMRGSI